MLDHLSGGRLILGIGRGAGKVEFDGFRLSHGRSRASASSSTAEMLLAGLETRLLRVRRQATSSSRARPSGPRPFKTFRGRTYAAAVSPESVQHHGRARRRHPDHPAEAVGRGGARSSTTYRARLPRGERRRRAAADLGRLDLLRRERRAGPRDGAPLHRRLLPDRCSTTTSSQGDHLAHTRGLRVLRQDEREDRSSTATDTVDRLLRRTCRSGARPSSATRRSSTSTRAPATSHYVGVFSYAGMPYDEAERNMRLFAEEVMPELKKLDTGAADARPAPVAEKPGVGLLGS